MLKEPLVIGVDLDGVVADYFGGIRPLAAEWIGVPEHCLPKDADYDLKRWGSDNWPGGFLALHKYAVVKNDLFSKLEPVKGAPQVLRKLSEQGFRIRIITYRLCMKWHHATAIKQTVDWLEKHDIPYWDICFVKDKSAVNADVYIDDSPTNHKILSAAGKNIWMFKQPWNNHLDATFVESWADIQYKLMSMKTMQEQKETLTHGKSNR